MDDPVSVLQETRSESDHGGCDVGFTLLASLLLWQLPQASAGAKLFTVYILASYGGGYAVLMSMQIANTAGYTKRSLGSSGMLIGYCLVSSLRGSRSAALIRV